MFLISQEFWEVKKTTAKGRGVFAKKDIAAGRVIGDYLGKLITNHPKNEEKYGVYDMYFNDAVSILPSKNDTGIHLINYSCSANCSLFPYKGHMLYFANRRIFKNEELSVNYFISPPEEKHLCNHICYCKSPICHGTMHISIRTEKLINKFINLQDGKNRIKTPLPLGRQLPVLASYPNTVGDYPIFDIFGNLEKQPKINLEKTIIPRETIRGIIRTTGRMIYFKNINLTVYGIMNGLLISM